MIFMVYNLFDLLYLKKQLSFWFLGGVNEFLRIGNVKEEPRIQEAELGIKMLNLDRFSTSPV